MSIKDFDLSYALWKKTKIIEFSHKKEQVYVKQMISLNPSSCLVGIEDNKIVATALGVFNGRRAWIYHFAVDPNYQKKGYGTQILNAAEKELKKVGADAILLWVYKTNKQVIPFYQKRNYKEFTESIALRKEL